MQRPMILCVVFIALTISTNVRAENVIDAHISAIGGEAAVAKVKTIQLSGKAIFESQQFGNFKGTVNESYVVGKKAHRVTDLGAFKDESGWNGVKGWVNSSQTGLEDADKQQLEQLQLWAAVDPILSIKNQYGLAAFEPLGDKEFDGTACSAVKVVDTDLVFFISKQSNQLIGMTTKADDPTPEFQFEIKVTFSDFHPVNGVQFPQKTLMDISDSDLMIVITNEYTDTKINEELDDAKFERPDN